MDPISILQNRIEQLEAKLGVVSGQHGDDSRVHAGDSVAAHLMNTHTALASGAVGHEKVTAAMAQATELNNYTSPELMQNMQQRQMQMHEVAAAEPTIRHHCHCMHRCKQAAPALESNVIQQVPQMQTMVENMKADTVSIKSDADAKSPLNSPRPNIQEHGNVQMTPHMQVQGNANTMNLTPAVYQASLHNTSPFQGHHNNAMQGNMVAHNNTNVMHGNPNLMHANPNIVQNAMNSNPNLMHANPNIAANAINGNPNLMHANPNIAPNAMHSNSHIVHGNTLGATNMMHGNPNIVHGNVDVVAGHPNVPHAHMGHANPNAMPHTQMGHTNPVGIVENAAHGNVEMPGHMANEIANPASPRLQPEVSQGIQQLAETCGATAASASEQLASVTQKVEQAELRKYQRRNGLD